jgi:glycosyltransferase involved in cell wall biosynthesis
MRAYDILILPSRYDGWGVVVNEALQAGVPVVVSKGAGASAMVRRWKCGEVYDGSARQLADTLARLSREPDRLARMREACEGIQPVLDPAVAGEYLHEILLEPEREVPNPWY